MSLDFFFYNEPADPDTLWDLMLNAASDEDSPPDVFAGLLMAWTALIGEEASEEIEFLAFKEAEILYQKAFVKAYNTDRSLRDYDLDNGVWWPDSMPTKGYFPKRVVIRVAQICASKEASETKALDSYLRREHP
tara:strand:+ start:2408 stop:2809 length:402 start_codon:yes stop_codon:yes gene_type:complete